MTLFVACSGDDGVDGSIDVPSPTPQASAISFSGTVSNDRENTTRSGDSSSAYTRAGNLEDDANGGVKEFRLWGYKNRQLSANGEYATPELVFGGYRVSHSAGSAGTTLDNSADWSYVTAEQSLYAVGQIIKYWDVDAKAYRFFAYAPGNGTQSLADTDGVAGGVDGLIATNVETGDKATDPALDEVYFEFTADVDARDRTDEEYEAQIASIPYISHLWFSNNAPGYPAYGEGVKMEFMKPLCQVKIVFVNSEGAAFNTANANDKKVVDNVTKGSILFRPLSPDEIVAVAGKVRITYPLTGQAPAAGSNGENCSCTPSGTGLIIDTPYESTHMLTTESQSLNRIYTVLPNTGQGAFEMSLTYGGVNRATTVPAEFVRWMPGFTYTYVFKLSDTSVDFLAQLFVCEKWQAGYSGGVVEW